MLRSRPAMTSGWVFALALMTGCAQADAPDESEASPDPVAARMLNSVQNPGLGLSGSVPLADGSEAPRQSQELDVASLGFNSGPAGAPVRTESKPSCVRSGAAGGSLRRKAV